jgi:hypothetical protein
MYITVLQNPKIYPMSSALFNMPAIRAQLSLSPENARQHHLVAPRDNKLAPRIYWYPGCANRELSGLAGKTVAAAQKMWGNTDAKGSFTTRTVVKHKVVEIHLGNQVRTSTL